MSSHTAPEPWPIDAEAFNAFEAAGWDKKAATYDRFFGQLTVDWSTRCSMRPA
jgi:hypothetical protein